MGDSAGQLSDGVHFLRLEQRFASALELALILLALGEIAGDLREAKEPSRFIADRVDNDVCPKESAILADPPTFFCEAAFALRRFQRAFRDAGLAIFRRVEAREMLPHNL